MKFEIAFFLAFFSNFLKKCLFPVFLIIFAYLASFFFYVFIVFSCEVVFDRIKNKNNSYLRCHVIRQCLGNRLGLAEIFQR
jgi:hypothetical protein